MKSSDEVLGTHTLLFERSDAAFKIHGLAFGHRSDLDSFRSGKALAAPGAFNSHLTRLRRDAGSQNAHT